ncbi:MAG TPA: MarR family transcriptional regulator [Rectinemataceae bacterium]|nr:MarR family transcriptional regulator [Rectinemataceae bacterium]
MDPSGPNLTINRVVRMAQAYINGRLKPIGLSSGLFYFILELMEHDGLSMQELSRAVMVDNAYTTRAVKALVDRGYLRKRPDRADARKCRVYLTAKGRGTSTAIQAALMEWADLVTEGVSDREVGVLFRVFDRYYVNARRHFEKMEADIG